jgi:hypothetical protein
VSVKLNVELPLVEPHPDEVTVPLVPNGLLQVKSFGKVTTIELMLAEPVLFTVTFTNELVVFIVDGVMEAVKVVAKAG